MPEEECEERTEKPETPFGYLLRGSEKYNGEMQAVGRHFFITATSESHHIAPAYKSLPPAG
jgi:hypothetical protein